MVWGLQGYAFAEVITVAEFVIDSAVCEGRCSHTGDGCPTERDVHLLRF